MTKQENNFWTGEHKFRRNRENDIKANKVESKFYPPHFTQFRMQI